MRDFSKTARSAALLLVPIMTLTTGCGLGPVAGTQSPGVTGLNPSVNTNSQTAANPNTQTTSPNTQTTNPNQTNTNPNAPNLTGPGASPDAPGFNILPAPAASKDKIAQLKQRFGLKDIRGSQATVDELNRLETAYTKFPKGSFENLDIFFEPIEGGVGPQDGGEGVWLPLDKAGIEGKELTEGGTPAAGRIGYMGKKIDTWVLVHEVGHHITIYTDAGFGHRVVKNLGYTLPSGSTSKSDDRTVMNEGEFKSDKVPASSFPTEYSRNAAQEHIAELISVHLARNDVPDGEELLKTFKWPANVQSEMRTKLGQTS